MKATGGRPAGRFFIGCHHGELDPRVRDSAVIAIDVIRATTTAITAVAGGRRCFPVGSVEEAMERAAGLDDAILAGELGGRKPAGFELQNSPVEVSADGRSNRPIVLLSTSGAPLLLIAAREAPTYAACLRNAEATAAHVSGTHPRVAILGADPVGRLRREDALCAARIGAVLRAAGYQPEDPFTERALGAWADAPSDAILGGRSASYLEASDQRHDLEFILDHIEDISDAYMITGGNEMIRAR
jgi:2-phosphosulfolactate phosphatase